MSWPDRAPEQHEIAAWLGDANRELTEDQLAEFTRRVRRPDAGWVRELEAILGGDDDG